MFRIVVLYGRSEVHRISRIMAEEDASSKYWQETYVTYLDKFVMCLVVYRLPKTTPVVNHFCGYMIDR